jgi:hypothetical protein
MFCSSLTLLCFGAPLVPEEHANNELFMFSFVMGVVGTAILFPFVLWSWGIVIKDTSGIDMMQHRDKPTAAFSMNQVRRSFKRVFGTESILLTFCPSFRKLSNNPWEHEIVTDSENFMR